VNTAIRIKVPKMLGISEVPEQLLTYQEEGDPRDLTDVK
jgi:hypothetical protein